MMTSAIFSSTLCWIFSISFLCLNDTTMIEWQDSCMLKLCPLVSSRKKEREFGSLCRMFPQILCSVFFMANGRRINKVAYYS